MKCTFFFPVTMPLTAIGGALVSAPNSREWHWDGAHDCVTAEFSHDLSVNGLVSSDGEMT
jgi:hypothetical protein